MPIRRDLYEQTIAEREAAEIQADRHRFWFSVRTILLCLVWQVVGGAVVVYAFHGVMPRERAQDLIQAGIGIAAAGTVLTVLLRGARLEERGY